MRSFPLRVLIQHHEKIGWIGWFSNRFELTLHLEFTELEHMIVEQRNLGNYLNGLQLPEAIAHYTYKPGTDEIARTDWQTAFTYDGLLKAARRPILYIFDTPAGARNFEGRAAAALGEIRRVLDANTLAPSHTTYFEL